MGKELPRQRIGIRWRHVIHSGHGTRCDELVLENYDTESHPWVEGGTREILRGDGAPELQRTGLGLSRRR